MRQCDIRIVIDEAHNSQGGEAAADLKEALGGERLREEAREHASHEAQTDMAESFRSMANPNLKVRFSICQV